MLLLQLPPWPASVLDAVDVAAVGMHKLETLRGSLARDLPEIEL